MSGSHQRWLPWSRACGRAGWRRGAWRGREGAGRVEVGEEGDRTPLLALAYWLLCPVPAQASPHVSHTCLVCGDEYF